MNKNLQHLNVQPNKPSKFCKIEPTAAAALAKFKPSQYLPLPSASELELLGTDEQVRVGFAEKEDIWINVEALDDDTIYGKIIGHVKHLKGLQMGQRITIKKEHVVEIKYGDHDSEDDE